MWTAAAGLAGTISSGARAPLRTSPRRQFGDTCETAKKLRGQLRAGMWLQRPEQFLERRPRRWLQVATPSQPPLAPHAVRWPDMLHVHDVRTALHPSRHASITTSPLQPLESFK